jgi:predicted alpha/beta hydrolase
MLERQPILETQTQPVTIRCEDGVKLGGQVWSPVCMEANRDALGWVIINPATGVLARYYRFYAAFLARHGFHVLTYDYRGIGLSRPGTLRGCGYRWRDWGERDFAAAVSLVRARDRQAPIHVVGHSIGGFLPGLAENAGEITRMLTVGAQYAYWRDYAGHRRARLFLKWHVAMPAMTALLGYFPGKRLGWLEDLPAGVAHEWSFRRARMELSHPRRDRDAVLARFAAITAPILAVTVSDDDLATPAAVARALAYYAGSPATQVLLHPRDYGLAEIGHFDLFHARHESGFWLDTVLWLRDGLNPWPAGVI